MSNVKEKTHYTTFDSPESYVDYLNNVEQRFKYSQQEEYLDREFLGGTFSEGINSLTNGDTKYLSRAQDIINQMADQNVFSSHQPELVNSIVGPIPNVAAYLAGQPLDMYNIVQGEEQNITTPINIYVETLVSAGISYDQLIARGVCVLAFALAMNNIRPVELYTICIGKDYHCSKSTGIVCKIPSKPIDLERAAFMLCDPLYYRQLAFSSICDHAKSNSGGINWPWNSAATDSDHEPKMRELLDMQPEDVFFTGGYLTDELMKTNPVQWVKNMIAKHCGTANTDC